MTGWGKEQMVQNGGCPGCVAEGWERVQSGETGKAEEGQVAKDLEMHAREFGPHSAGNQDHGGPTRLEQFPPLTAQSWARFRLSPRDFLSSRKAKSQEEGAFRPLSPA